MIRIRIVRGWATHVMFYGFWVNRHWRIGLRAIFCNASSRSLSTYQGLQRADIVGPSIDFDTNNTSQRRGNDQQAIHELSLLDTCEPRKRNASKARRDLLNK